MTDASARRASAARGVRRGGRLLQLQEAGEERVERHATWTELFFDLVFVVAVGQLASGLHEDPSLSGAVAFVGLFAPVWWTWTTYAYVADLFDADDGPFRVILLGAMLLVAAMAATTPAAFDGRTTGFAIAYAALRVDLLAIYAWAWWSDRALRDLVRPHFLGFSTGLAIWLSSLAVAAPARYGVWAVAIAVDLTTGVVAYLGNPEAPRHRSHMPERFGAFALIVLGESVIAISAGTARADWAVSSVTTAVTGFVLAATLWWMYFARFDDSVFDWALAGGISERRRAFVFGYAHLVILGALAAVGTGVRLAIDTALAHGDAGRPAAVLGVALACYLVGLSLIQRAAPRGLPGRAIAGRLALAVGACLLAILGPILSAASVVAAAAAASLVQVVLEAVQERRLQT